MKDPAVLSAVVIALGSFLVAVVTNRQNRAGAKATNTLSERVVNREEFDSIMDRLEKENTRSEIRISHLEDRLEEEAKLRAEADQRAIEAEKRAARAEERAAQLERRVTQLEEALERNHIPIPPFN